MQKRIKRCILCLEDAIKILQGLQHKYELHHKAKYSDEAINSAVLLSERYLTGRFLPDKAIDIMDEAGAKARIGAMTRPPKFKDLEQSVEDIRKEKEEAIEPKKMRRGKKKKATTMILKFLPQLVVQKVF